MSGVVFGNLYNISQYKLLAELLLQKTTVCVFINLFLLIKIHFLFCFSVHIVHSFAYSSPVTTLSWSGLWWIWSLFWDPWRWGGNSPFHCMSSYTFIHSNWKYTIANPRNLEKNGKPREISTWIHEKQPRLRIKPRTLQFCCVNFISDNQAFLFQKHHNSIPAIWSKIYYSLAFFQHSWSNSPQKKIYSINPTKV